MKKILITLAIGFSSMLTAQEGKSEITIDVADGIVMKSLELGYEYYLMDSTSAGLTTLFNFSKAESSFRYNEKNMITPYLRHYLSADSNWNYFGELFFGINSGYKEDMKNHTDLALGACLGIKYVSDEGIVLSGFGGIGRNLLNKDSYILVPRAGIAVGYRF